ncbi:hypothetical protein NDU88_002715 [Pleurodeles waltl]|uniref:Uncharacterized protein n=1 Tax=Pleurodeles waltl TaxID=8319 RepID=A0AAV7VDA0_PLEWA|nr:hypothetical protein NDU88_002715 [Pleurodeles waltl]
MCTREGSLLGLLRYLKTVKAANRVIDLAMLIACKLIAMHCKAPIMLEIVYWCMATLKWEQAEAVALRQEEACGVHKYPIAADWETLLLGLQTYQEGLVG